MSPAAMGIGMGLLGSEATLIRFAVGAVLNGVLYAGALLVRQRMLTGVGLAHAVFLGVLLYTCLGWAGYALCLGFLLAGSAATRIGRREKEARGIAEKRGGARGPENLWGAAGAAAICAVLSALLQSMAGVPGVAAAWLGGVAGDASQVHALLLWLARLCRLAYVAALATKTSDTFASEVGKAYGEKTYLVTTLQRVPRGTEGAVSLEGTLAGVVGSIGAAVLGQAMKLVSGPWAIAIIVIAAFIATTAESVIGATIQESRKWSNEFVNFINTSIGAGTAALLGALVHCCGL